MDAGVNGRVNGSQYQPKRDQRADRVAPIRIAPLTQLI